MKKCAWVFVLFFLCAITANTVHSQPVSLPQAVLESPKLHQSADVLAPILQGRAETPVIVTLTSPPVAAQLWLKVQAGGATGPLFDLEGQEARQRVRQLVRQTLDRVLPDFASAGIDKIRKFSYQFGFGARVTPDQLEFLLKHPQVSRVEPDLELRPHLAQGVPLMRASTVRADHDGSGVSIAICDTGIDTSHPRLGGGGFPNSKVIGGYDFGDNDPDPRPGVFGEPHGTACAGIAAGNTGTVGDYIGGVAPGAKLYALKITSGNSGAASSSALIAAWEWSITHQYDNPANPIMIISTSFGGGGYSATCDTELPSLTTAAANAVAAGMTVFASSGNEGYCNAISFPACISTVHAVGAVYDAAFGMYYPCVDGSSCVAKTATSQCGTGWYASDTTAADRIPSYSNSSSSLTLLAPANRAYTTDIAGSGGYAGGDYTATFGGTSAAAPYAAGAAALLQGLVRSRTGSFLSPVQLRDILVNAGDWIRDPRNGISRPRINLDRSSQRVKDTTFIPSVLLLLQKK